MTSRGLAGIVLAGVAAARGLGSVPFESALPGLDSRVFAPGVVSTPKIERAVAFLRGDRVVIFDRRAGKWGGAEPSSLYRSDRRDGEWQPARLLPFSGRYSDTDPFASPDGRRVFFTSERPTPEGALMGREIWSVDALPDGGWGEPRHLPLPVGSPALEMGASVAADGTLYFASDRSGGFGSGDLYLARLVDGGYPRVENLGSVVNGPSGEWNVGVATDQSFIVFESSGRPAGKGPGGDLYLSYRLDGAWSPPIHLAAISTPGSDLMPRVSPDGARLYFASSLTLDGTQTDVYSVSLPALLAAYPPPAARSRSPAGIGGQRGPLGVRNAHGMVYDGRRGQVLLFGGADATAVRGDTWAWDGRSWEPLGAVGPAARTFPAMAFDEARERTILFGGRRVLFGREGETGTFLGDTWEFDGRSWREIVVEGPSPRAEAAVTYDAGRGCIVLFGGYSQGSAGVQRLGDTWEWDGEGWRLRAETGPRARNGASLVFDPVRGESVLFGGSGGPLADTWTWDGSRWRQLAVVVPGRFNAAAVWDAASGSVLRFGGWNGRERTADTFFLDLAGWRPRAVDAPPARNHAALAYDSRRRRAVLFGGHDGELVFGDTWEWDGRRWELRQAAAAERRVSNGH